MDGATDSASSCNVRTAVGGAMLVLVLASWQSMGELAQDLQEDFPSPYFTTWILHSAYTLLFFTFLPVVWAYKWWQGKGGPRITWRMVKLSAQLNIMLLASDYLWVLSLTKTLVYLNSAIYQTISVFVYLLSIPLLHETAVPRKTYALCLCVLGVSFIMLSQSDFVSGGTTGPPSNGTQPVVHQCLRAYPNLDQSMCYASDDIAPSSNVWYGYVLVLVSVVFYALYEVAFKRCGEREHFAEGAPIDEVYLLSQDQSTEFDKIRRSILDETGDEVSHEAGGAWADVVHTLTVVGLMGLTNIVLMWVLFPLLNLTGLETFIWPLQQEAGGGCCWTSITNQLVINAMFGVLYTSSFLVGVALTNPLFMSTGLILIIPVGYVVDSLLGKVPIYVNETAVTCVEILAIILIVVGFVFINVAVKLPCARRPHVQLGES